MTAAYEITSRSVRPEESVRIQTWLLTLSGHERDVLGALLTHPDWVGVKAVVKDWLTERDAPRRWAGCLRATRIAE